MSRLIDDDYSGAITSACGAVDLVTQAIYENHVILETRDKVHFRQR